MIVNCVERWAMREEPNGMIAAIVNLRIAVLKFSRELYRQAMKDKRGIALLWAKAKFWLKLKIGRLLWARAY